MPYSVCWHCKVLDDTIRERLAALITEVTPLADHGHGEGFDKVAVSAVLDCVIDHIFQTADRDLAVTHAVVTGSFSRYLQTFDVTERES